MKSVVQRHCISGRFRVVDVHCTRLPPALYDVPFMPPAWILASWIFVVVILSWGSAESSVVQWTGAFSGNYMECVTECERCWRHVPALFVNVAMQPVLVSFRSNSLHLLFIYLIKLPIFVHVCVCVQFRLDFSCLLTAEIMLLFSYSECSCSDVKCLSSLWMICKIMCNFYLISA